MFYIGTALCIVAFLLVGVVALGFLTKVWLLLAVGIVTAGFGLQVYAVWKKLGLL